MVSCSAILYLSNHTKCNVIRCCFRLQITLAIEHGFEKVNLNKQRNRLMGRSHLLFIYRERCLSVCAFVQLAVGDVIVLPRRLCRLANTVL